MSDLSFDRWFGGWFWRGGQSTMMTWVRIPALL